MRFITAAIGVSFCCFFATCAEAREINLEERVAAQRAIEQVYWNHRIWPKENPGPKPPLRSIMSDEHIRTRVDDYVRKSNALDAIWHRPIEASQLQAELDRMARQTRDAAMLQELFHALGDDAVLIGETLVRQTLADRLIRNWQAGGSSFEAWWRSERTRFEPRISRPAAGLVLPKIPLAPCTPGTWEPIASDLLRGQSGHTAVWTGTEMIVWGGADVSFQGQRYEPSTDTWTPVPAGPLHRRLHVAVWTGTEMIVWGGYNHAAPGYYLQSGARFNPTTGAWTATAVDAGTPSERTNAVAVWTGNEMIVWGGDVDGDYLHDGGRYSPVSDSWVRVPEFTYVSALGARAVWTGSRMILWGGYEPLTPLTGAGAQYDPVAGTWRSTSMGNAPEGREDHVAVWTGNEMVVWGGNGLSGEMNSGGRYNPLTDTWTPTSTSLAPAKRRWATAVWSGSEMIVWGGGSGFATGPLGGGRYDPSTDTWRPVSGSGPIGRAGHSAVWTGTEMIVWGGGGSDTPLDTGGRYLPGTDTWVLTAVSSPHARQSHSATWTGSEMIVWGGSNSGAPNGGERYVPATDSWSFVSNSDGLTLPVGAEAPVWTGTELIVWGGRLFPPSNTLTNLGARYDPSNDHWTSTSTGAHCPTPRWGYSTVWTGAEMIVWGGATGPSLNDGGRYDPSTDTWGPTSTVNAPEARWGHVAVWTGTEMLVWAGLEDSVLPTGGRYRPATDTWSPMANNYPDAGKRDVTGVWTGSELIVWGGSNGAYQRHGATYRPDTNSWSPMQNQSYTPEPSKSRAIWSGQEVIIWGGKDGSDDFDVVGTGARFRPSTGLWTPIPTTANVPFPRDGHSMAFTGTRMIVFGGMGYPGAAGDDGAAYCVCASSIDVYRDADGDGHGHPSLWIPVCAEEIPAGYVTDNTDCDDADPSTYRLAPELNDGRDNQCAGDLGYGSIDEISGTAGFFSSGDDTTFSWPVQAGATSYEVARSRFADFHGGCSHFTTVAASFSDPAIPPSGTLVYYLVRVASPFTGSWGQVGDSGSFERTVCAGCVTTGDWCDDDSVCTGGDVCAGTTCTGAVLNCEDGNPCTNDSCNPSTGCVHTNNTDVCDDGNVCTTGDVCGGGVCAGTAPTFVNHLVISQIQVSGDGFSPSQDEFVELYNPTSSPISLSGYSLQGVNVGPFSLDVQVHQFFSGGTVPAHGWYLIRGIGYNGTVAYDSTNSFELTTNLDAVLLVQVANAVTSCSQGTIVDKVGYGTTTCYEGASVPVPTANNSIIRRPAGVCGNGVDTNSNSADFLTQAPSTPRNSASTPQP